SGSFPAGRPPPRVVERRLYWGSRLRYSRAATRSRKQSPPPEASAPLPETPAPGRQAAGKQTTLSSFRSLRHHSKSLQQRESKPIISLILTERQAMRLPNIDS